MPTRPQVKNLNATSVEILNTLRDDIGGNYADTIPYAVNVGETLPNGNIATHEDAMQSLRSIGNVMMQHTPLQNAFLSALMNRIGRVLITNRLYSNPWARFKKGLLEYGETVEEIFVNITKAFEFDPAVAEKEVFKRNVPDVRAAFHTMNYQVFYKSTVSNDQLRQAFLSWEGITDLISKIIEAMYTSANYDEFVTMKYLIARNALAGNIASNNIPEVNSDNANSIVSTIKGVSNVLEFMSTDYNMAGVTTYTDKRYQFLIMNAQFNAVIDVEVLAKAFNLDKAEFMGNTVLVDSFTLTDTEMERLDYLFASDPSYARFTEEELQKLTTIPCILVDESWFMIFDNLYDMTEIYNAQGLYWNYFYHTWKTFSVSPFNNALMWSTETSSVTSVIVSPSAVSVAKGQTAQLSATVEVTGFESKKVVWSLTGNASQNTTISQTGVITVSPEETSETITVTATSIADKTKTGTATVTVTD